MSGCKPGCCRTLYTEGTLLEQLKLKWVQARCAGVLSIGGALIKQLELRLVWVGVFQGAPHKCALVGWLELRLVWDKCSWSALNMKHPSRLAGFKADAKWAVSGHSVLGVP